MSEPAVEPSTDVAPVPDPAPDYGYIGSRILVYGGILLSGVVAAWVTMRLLNRRSLYGLTDVQYLPPSTVSQYGVVQAKREFYIDAKLPKGLGGQVRTVDTADGEGWVAVDDVYNYKSSTDAKGNVIPALGPLYDSRCDEKGVYGCTSRNPADPDVGCVGPPGQTWLNGTIDNAADYCRQVWRNNAAWWATYNSVYSDTAGALCKLGDAYVDCKTQLPYGEQAVKCFNDLEYRNANQAYCEQFRSNYCSGVMDQIGCVYANELPYPNEVDWSQAGLTVIRIGTNGFHWPDNRGKDTVRVLPSPVVDGTQPNLPVCLGDAADPRCQTGNELVPIRTAARFAGSSNTILGYGYYSGNTGAVGEPSVPNGQFTNSFPQKSQCAGSACYPKTENTEQSDVWQHSRRTFYNTKSTLRSGGQA